MPPVRVVFYQDADGTAPAIDWLDRLPQKARDKCRVRIERLPELGHELRRPEADFLRDGIYELRTRMGSVNYRLLYFFHGNTVAVVSHGITKEKDIPAKEIDRALEHKAKFVQDPERHTHIEEYGWRAISREIGRPSVNQRPMPLRFCTVATMNSIPIGWRDWNWSVQTRTLPGKSTIYVRRQVCHSVSLRSWWVRPPP